MTKRGRSALEKRRADSAEPMSKIFFYGLFTDRTLLAERGLRPEMVGPAVLRDDRIQIGERATLLRSASSRADGIVMKLADQEARALDSDYVDEIAAFGKVSSSCLRELPVRSG